MCAGWVAAQPKPVFPVLLMDFSCVPANQRSLKMLAGWVEGLTNPSLLPQIICV